MFTVTERERVSASIIERARRDNRVAVCALLGSAARGELDDWSDIDVALGVASGTALDDVVATWTDWLRNVHEVVDTFDIRASGALYRVFLLANSLQIDLSFWPDCEFRSTGEPLSIVFGGPVAEGDKRSRDPHDLIAMGWLYGLHARAAVKRGRAWQAEMMTSGVRDQVIALACLRCGLNPAQGRDAHRLPSNITQPLSAARAVDLSRGEQARSLSATLALYQAEVTRHDRAKAVAIRPAIDALGSS